MSILSYAAREPNGKLEPFEYDPGELARDEVEIAVDYCGICHSDLSMWTNEWQISAYPLVLGHEVSGTVAARGEGVTHLELGQKVGLGWFSRSCGICAPCIGGDYNLCPQGEGTIVARHGGFSNRVRTQALWAIPLPDGVDPASAGPLFCGGITVFNPIIQYGVSPTDRVGVVGIGGLGHMALQFLSKWGCEVTAFSSPGKEASVRELGAHHFVNSREEAQLESLANSLDLLLVTVNVGLNWDLYLSTLKPKGRLHMVGAAPKVEATVMGLIGGQKSISGSPLGSPGTTAKMLDFSARHGIAPKTEVFPMSEVNEAMSKLQAESPSHRIVLKNDFG